eukprot:c40975_g1_i1 orf=278-799(+)
MLSPFSELGAAKSSELNSDASVSGNALNSTGDHPSSNHKPNISGTTGLLGVRTGEVCATHVVEEGHTGEAHATHVVKEGAQLVGACNVTGFLTTSLHATRCMEPISPLDPCADGLVSLCTSMPITSSTLSTQEEKLVMCKRKRTSKFRAHGCTSVAEVLSWWAEKNQKTSECQ